MPSLLGALVNIFALSITPPFSFCKTKKDGEKKECSPHFARYLVTLVLERSREMKTRNLIERGRKGEVS